MKAPPQLQALIDAGLIDTVVRQLMSGKEATNRSFRQAVGTAGNKHAQRKLLRTDYGPEIWSLYQAQVHSPMTPCWRVSFSQPAKQSIRAATAPEAAP